MRSSAFLIIVLLGVCLSSLTGCMSKRGEMGVRNDWRDPALAGFEKGRTTESEVMAALGPPSQVIALRDQTLFYYLREESKTSSMFLLIYNQTRQQISYDRAIFFFDTNSVLTKFSYSKEAIPHQK